MRRYIAGGLLLLPWLPSPAQEAIYKCDEGQGRHAYQSMPCAEGATLRHWEVAAFQTNEAADAKQSREARPTAQPGARRASSSDVSHRNAPHRRAANAPDPHARCLAARAGRETALARLGLKRRYEDLRRLNDRVSAACNHRPPR